MQPQPDDYYCKWTSIHLSYCNILRIGNTPSKICLCNIYNFSKSFIVFFIYNISASIFVIVWIKMDSNSIFTLDRERRNPRHPEVGRARAPDFANIRPKVLSTAYRIYHLLRKKLKGTHIYLYLITNLILTRLVPKHASTFLLEVKWKFSMTRIILRL